MDVHYLSTMKAEKVYPPRVAKTYRLKPSVVAHIEEVAKDKGKAPAEIIEAKFDPEKKKTKK